MLLPTQVLDRTPCYTLWSGLRNNPRTLWMCHSLMSLAFSFLVLMLPHSGFVSGSRSLYPLRPDSSEKSSYPKSFFSGTGGRWPSWGRAWESSELGGLRNVSWLCYLSESRGLMARQETVTWVYPILGHMLWVAYSWFRALSQSIAFFSLQ